MIRPGEFTWLKGGIALALVAAIATILVKPIGVSTQFVVTDTIIWKTLDKDIVQVTEKDGNFPVTVREKSNCYERRD